MEINQFFCLRPDQISSICNCINKFVCAVTAYKNLIMLCMQLINQKTPIHLLLRNVYIFADWFYVHTYAFI